MTTEDTITIFLSMSYVAFILLVGIIFTYIYDMFIRKKTVNKKEQKMIKFRTTKADGKKENNQRPDKWGIY